MDHFRPTLRKLKLTHLRDFLYGGVSSTFKKHSKANIKLMDARRIKESVSTRKMEKSYSLRLKELSGTYPENQEKNVSPTVSPDEEISDGCKVFYPWESISIYRSNMTSLDLVINDYNYVMALLHILHVRVFKPSSLDFMKIYKQLKLKMKLAYEAWNRKIELNSLIHYAILKTLQQKMADSTKALHKFANDPRYND